jgi:hypothetical protein
MELSKKQNNDIWQICDTNPEYAVAIVTTFLDYLGAVSKSEFSSAMDINIRTVERNCRNGKIPTLYNMPLINVYNKQLQHDRT